ncbi:MAG: CoA transferase [Pseudonocardiaceae bacterium]|nr:CoA transferase [Pseudonocardiaceae bacterium]
MRHTMQHRPALAEMTVHRPRSYPQAARIVCWPAPRFGSETGFGARPAPRFGSETGFGEARQAMARVPLPYAERRAGQSALACGMRTVPHATDRTWSSSDDQQTRQVASETELVTGQADGPLAGVKVVDLTTTFMGPYCTLMMARMGADVLKVEAPGGDILRYVGDGRNPAMGPIFLNSNHGKRSIALDLKRGEGREVLLRLVAGSDVFVTNMRPDALWRLGLGYADIDTANPRCVYCTLPGFGSRGPYRDYAAYDDVIQAVSGIAAVQGGSDAPSYVRTPIADKTVGLMGMGTILAALYQREQTGRGQAVEVPMFESMTAFSLLEQQGGHVFDPPTGPVGYSRTASPYRRPYRTADGYLGVVIYTDRQWLSFFDLIGRPELATEPRFRTITERTENIDELYQLIEAELPARSTEDWAADFEALGIPAVPVQGVAELFHDEHLRAVDFFEQIDHPSEGRLTLARLPMSFSTNPQPQQRPAPGWASTVRRCCGSSDTRPRT